MTGSFSAEPLIGWRVWNLVMDRAGREPALRPAGAGRGEWLARRPYRATCRRVGLEGSMPTGRHASPVLECTCGIYASSSLRNLVTSTPAMPPVSAVGTVALWGRVIEHHRGWRAEFAYPDRLTLVCVVCLQQGSGAGVPAFVAAQPVRPGPYPAVAVCRDHAASVIAGPRAMSPAVVVRSALLGRYAVDLMPFDSVRSLFERDPVPVPFMRTGSRAAAPPRQAPTLTPTPTTPTPVAPASPVGRPSIERRVARGIGEVVSFMFSAALFIVMCVWSLQSCVVTVPDSDAATSPPPVVVPSPEVTEPSTEAVIRRPPDREVSEIPDFAFVCGIPHGWWVELVSCSRPGTLIGFASSPPDTECLRGDVAMTRRHSYSICWHSFDGPVDLVPHPAAADPFEDER